MNGGLPFRPGLLLRDARAAARVMARRLLLASLGAATAVVGLGFLLFAAFDALRLVFGPGPAAWIIGAALILAALALFRAAARAGRSGTSGAPPAAAVSPQESGTPPTSAESGASALAFTAAFVLGRVVADRMRR